MSFNLMVKSMSVVTSGQTDLKVRVNDNDNKFKNIYEQKKLQVDDKSQASKFTRSEKNAMEKPKVQDEDIEEENQTQKILKDQDVHKSDKKQDKKGEIEDEEKIKEKEIRKRLRKLAEALGIDPGEAAKLIMSGELKDIKDPQEKIEMLVEKLTALSDVGEEEKPKLAENLRKIIKGIFEEAAESSYSLAKGKQELDVENQDKVGENDVKEEIRDSEYIKDINNSQDKTKLEESHNKTDDGTKRIENESVNPEIKNTDNKQNTEKKDGTLENKKVNSDNQIEIKDDEKRPGTDNEGETKNKDEKQSGWTEKVKVMFKVQEKAENTFRLPAESNIQAFQPLQETQIDQKVQLKTSSFVLPRRDEILNQIIDKAAVTLTADKAEMVINLKPDHLGKLEMKLATEKGIMNAQIIAENQQVKQIIESNFNVLKDALEKQGIAVQSFSVSVGNHNWNRGFQNSQWKSQNNNNQRQSKTNGVAVSNVTYLQDINTSNRIMWPDSTVNYTA